VNWDAVGAVAEMLGGFGVIASLFYLGVQIRQNTRSVRSASYHGIVANLSSLSGAIGRDVDAANIATVGGENPEGLNSKEQAQFRLLMISLFRSYENIFYQYSQNMIEPSVWRGWAISMTRQFWLPGVQAWWPGWRDHCHADFRSFLESSEASVDASSGRLADS
jgi:hypothetical protein